MKIFTRGKGGNKIRNKDGSFEMSTISSGCVNNPAPSTPRGNRRHEARGEDRKVQVQKLWGSDTN